MSCSSCKKKKSGNFHMDTINQQTKNMSKYVLWGMVVWSLLGLYGLYTLFSKIL